MEYIKVIVDRRALEFEIVEQNQDYESFAIEIANIYKKTGILVTSYNPCSRKNTHSMVIKDWKDRGFHLVEGIYQKLKEFE